MSSVVARMPLVLLLQLSLNHVATEVRGHSSRCGDRQSAFAHVRRDATAGCSYIGETNYRPANVYRDLDTQKRHRVHQLLGITDTTLLELPVTEESDT